MKLLLVGGGGGEHALVWKLRRDDHPRPADFWSHTGGSTHRDVEEIREGADGSRGNPDGAFSAAQ